MSSHAHTSALQPLHSQFDAEGEVLRNLFSGGGSAFDFFRSLEGQKSSLVR
jgi:hypothetical protein